MSGFGEGYMGLSQYGLKPEDHPEFVPVPLEVYIEYAQKVEEAEQAGSEQK
jgi:hypothetical protein